MDFWVGNTHTSDPSEQAPPDPRHPPCPHGPFRSIGFFFNHRPIRIDHPFFTTFSPGIGHAWFVEGQVVTNMASGWTDVDKQTALGDQIWPSPMIIMSENQDQATATVSVAFAFDDAWLGGSSLLFDILVSDLDSTGSITDNSPVSLAYIPLQSVLLTSGVLYSVQVVAKIEPTESNIVEVLPVILLSDGTQSEVALNEPETPTNGWVVRAGFFTLPEDAETLCSLGMAIHLTTIDSDTETSELPLRIHLGMISVKPLDSITARPVVSTMKWTPSKLVETQKHLHTLSGSLDWQTSVTIPFSWQSAVNLSHLQDKSDPVPRWTFDDSEPTNPSARWYPTFAYHNIFMQPFSSEDLKAARGTTATFIGTTEQDSRDEIKFTNVVFHQDSGASFDWVRVYLRGVSDSGEIVPWDETPFIDIPIS